MTVNLDIRSSQQPVLFAGDELKRYLEQMLPTGEGVLSVCLETREDPGRNDAFHVSVTQTEGRITGSNPRSVLLAVYDYLQALGCRFLGPGRAGEVIPSISPEDLPAEYGKQASFFHRGVCIEGADSAENILDFIDWLPKLGYNSFFLQFKVPYAFMARWYHHEENPTLAPEPFTMEDGAALARDFESAMVKRGLMLHKFGHGWTGEILDTQTVGSWDRAGHPITPEKEPYAAMIGGKRGFFHGVPANTNLCLSNCEAVQAFADHVVRYARENPNVDYLHIWLADEYNNVCECKDCAETTLSDQYVALLNEIDRQLTAESLDTKVVFLLYQELLWPPIRERLANPDRFVLMFAPISRTFASSYDISQQRTEVPAYVRNQITLPTSLGENLAFLRSWQAIFEGDGFVYDYPLGRAHYGDFGYLHIASVISQDIKKLHGLGLNGYISCQELRAGMPNTLPNYVMGRTLFDENVSVQEIIQEYFQAAYPQAPELALEYLGGLSARSVCDYINGKGPRVDPQMERRMEAVCQWCTDWESKLREHQQGTFWKILSYHNGYISRLASALAALSAGKQEEAGQRYQILKDYITRGEPEFQPYLDVYRILEVTKKYTGFSDSPQ